MFATKRRIEGHRLISLPNAHSSYEYINLAIDRNIKIVVVLTMNNDVMI